MDSRVEFSRFFIFRRAKYFYVLVFQFHGCDFIKIAREKNVFNGHFLNIFTNFSRANIWNFARAYLLSRQKKNTALILNLTLIWRALTLLVRKVTSCKLNKRLVKTQVKLRIGKHR